ncbi:hypothetical protein PsorP6_008845 [Peronosclerospora sorghi]|uniref:Uncharacterized protein n=1 Tax=Peronosclerospora sorghi TaxID=230839 RepID=A0ACC0W0K9_9STRA|nr:hypothetical protein PsorP6_008845 [Peronosclerospora sorghi]
MTKSEECRADWVAVEAQFQNGDAGANQPLKAKSAYQFFQKRVIDEVKRDLSAKAAELNEPFELGSISKEISARWAQLSTGERKEFVELAAIDKKRYEDECRARDEEVEKERARKREELYGAVEGKRERKKTQVVGDETRPKRQPREVTEKQMEAKKVRKEIQQQVINERDELKAEEKRQKEALAQKRSELASARLKYLLSQSDIFAHFSGQVQKKGKKRVVVNANEKMEPNVDNDKVTGKKKAKKRTSNDDEDEMDSSRHVGVRITKQPNWLAEFGRWCPSLRAVKFHGNKEERLQCVQEVLCPGLPDDKRKFDVCVTTFEMCLKEKAALCKFAWRYLVIDEAHRIKNESSQFSTVVRMLDTEHRLLLTGTPLQNNLHELWALLNFLLPDVFASSQEFDDWFNLDVDDDEAKKQMISQLHKILRPFMLRRLKADVEKSLPPKKETLLFVGMSEMQKVLYKSLLLRDMNTIMGGSAGVSKSALQNIVMQLRKCCGHPYLFEGQEDRSLDPLGEHVVENCGKMVLLDKLLKKLKQRGSRVLIFTQMTRVLDIMEDFCRMRQYEYCRIDGQTSYEDRESSIEEYNRPNSSKFLFLLSTRAGGLGINLYTADVVILYDSDWNPQADLQAQDRAHRIGQKKEVNVYRLVTTDSVEEKIIERAQQKLKLDAMVVQQGRLQEKQTKLTKNDILEMIRFGADQVFRTTDSTITDEDIDAILAKGEQRTEEMKQKMQVHDKGDMLDFKLDGGGCQNHDGIDYSNEKERQEELKRLADAELARQMAEGMGKRERRTVLRHSLVSSESKHHSKQKQLPKVLRLPRLEEWQFYNRKRLIELHEIECANYEQAKAEVEKPPLPPFAQYLTKEELEEKERLLAEGFGDWNKPQFFLFIKLLARYGRGNIEAVAREMMKPLDEIEKYAKAFLARGQDELSDWHKIMKSIEKGESKLLEIERLTEETARKVKRYANPWEDMPINYQGKGGKVFTEEEDRVLLCLVNKFGYGVWDRIKQEICSMKMFAFDYYLRSRTAAEIGRRCDALMRICEKDNADLEIRERKEHDVRRVLQEQRAKLDQELAAARDDVKQHQARVDELIMKEAKRMQKQRENKRAKKRKECDQNEDLVDRYTEALVSFLMQATSMDAAKVALDFCAKIKRETNEELQPSYVLKKIRQVAELDENATKGTLAWTIKTDFVNMGLKNESKRFKQEHMDDVDCAKLVKSEQEDKERLPRSPWSPTAMKQNQAKEKKVKKEVSGFSRVRKPRSAYVLFSIANRVEVKKSLGDKANLVDAMRQISQIWKDMTPEEKAPWCEAAKQDQLRYEREMNETAT